MEEQATTSVVSARLEQLSAQAKGTFWEYLGCEILTAEPGHVVLKLDAGSRHLNTIGIVHGGVVSSLLDNAMGLATMLARPEENTVTSNLNVHFVKSLQAEELCVTAEIVHETRRTITCTGRVCNADGQLCCLGMATFRVI